MKWGPTEAQHRLEEVMERVNDEGPQIITWNDEEYVLLTKAEYLRLTVRKPTFIEHLLSIPKGDDLDLRRNKSSMRDIEW